MCSLQKCFARSACFELNVVLRLGKVKVSVFEGVVNVFFSELEFLIEVLLTKKLE